MASRAQRRAAARKAEQRAAGPTGKVSQAQSPRPLSQQYLRLGPQRPEGVAAIMRLADTGYMWQLCDLLEHLRTTDCHLQTVCSRRERAVSGLPWQVLPASERPRDLRVAAWVEDRLKAFGGERIDGQDLRSLGETVVHLNAAPIHGYSGAEVPWRKDGRYVVPSGSLPMAPRRFVYSTIDASLRWWDSSGPLYPYPGKDLLGDYPAGRFLLHRPRVNGAVGSREGLIRPLCWAAVFRTWSVGDMLKLAELAWKPYRMGKYKSQAGQQDIDDLELALQELTSNGWTTFNEEKVNILIEYAKNRSAGDGGLHIALANFLAAEMSKVTLGATLTVEEGTRGTARTAGVHQDVSVEVRDADARGEEGTFQRQLVSPLVRYNFGRIPLPQFRFITEDGADIEALSKALERMLGPGQMFGTGLDIPARWVRAQFGIPEPDEGEELVAKPPRKSPAEAAEEAAAQVEKPTEKPATPAADEDDGEGPEVSEQAMRAMLRAYHTDRALQVVGLRRPRFQAREAA